MKNNPLRTEVFAIIDKYPVGAKFTTDEILGKCKYRFASVACVASFIRQRADVLNTTDKKNIAIWEKVSKCQNSE